MYTIPVFEIRVFVSISILPPHHRLPTNQPRGMPRHPHLMSDGHKTVHSTSLACLGGVVGSSGPETADKRPRSCAPQPPRRNSFEAFLN